MRPTRRCERLLLDDDSLFADYSLDISSTTRPAARAACGAGLLVPLSA